MCDCNSGNAEFDINEFAAWVEKNYDRKLTLYNAKYVESLMRGEREITYQRASGKLEAKRLLEEYLDAIRED